MIVINDLDHLATIHHHDLVIAIGNFDGVHLGHRQLLKATTEKADLLHARSMVLTFEPHPARFFNRSHAPKMLISQARKADLIREMGLEILSFIQFNQQFAGLAPETFVKEILQKKIGPKAVLVGFNFTFGRHGSGDTGVLIELGKTYGFEVEVIPPVYHQGLLVSSSLIREALLDGNVELARQLLSYWPVLEGTVVRGYGRGKTIGFPTANLKINEEILIPAPGVYAATAEVEKEIFKSVINIGCCPTFANPFPSLEAHLLNFNGNLYGKTVKVHLHKRLRAEQKFHDIQELKKQILRDIAEAEFACSRG
ncbi:MAG: bifunctional riboflavin kinase/FAD synthetase [Bacillota bacterium]